MTLTQELAQALREFIDYMNSDADGDEAKQYPTDDARVLGASVAVRLCANELAAVIRKIEQDSAATEPEPLPLKQGPTVALRVTAVRPFVPPSHEDSAATGAQGGAVAK